MMATKITNAMFKFLGPSPSTVFSRSISGAWQITGTVHHYFNLHGGE
jgi:hypothetical protein